MFLDHFDALMLKIIQKNIILIHFRIENTLKNNHSSALPTNDVGKKICVTIKYVMKLA